MSQTKDELYYDRDHQRFRRFEYDRTTKAKEPPPEGVVFIKPTEEKQEQQKEQTK